jgi:hypothetical protein
MRWDVVVFAELFLDTEVAEVLFCFSDFDKPERFMGSILFSAANNPLTEGP